MTVHLSAAELVEGADKAFALVAQEMPRGWAERMARKATKRGIRDIVDAGPKTPGERDEDTKTTSPTPGF